MEDLAGNPHVHEGPQIATAETINEGFIAQEGITAETVFLSELARNTEVSLAIAFEQRTANLLALADCVRTDGARAAIIDAACERMGLLTAMKTNS